MRVALDGYPLAEPRAGIGHYTLELAVALARLASDDEFELVSPKPFEPAALEDLQRANLTNLQAVQADSSSVRGHWWAVGLPLYARRSRFDLFHGTNYDLPLWSGCRSVLTIHDLSTLLHPEKHLNRLVRRTRLRLPLAVRRASLIITPTESVKREVIEHLGVAEARVVPIHSAPRAHFQPMTSAPAAEVRKVLGVEDDFLLFVGTLEPRKNLLSLLRAFEQILLNTSWQPQLVIAGGEGWLMDEMFSFVNQARITDRLRFTGYLSDEQLRALYSACRAFVYPSVYEGFGFPPLEAMACGAPVIAGRIAALQETLGDAATLVEPLDIDGLANAITDLLRDDRRRQELAEAGLARARKFSWVKTAQQTWEVYQQAMKQGALRRASFRMP
jgi:glycosyltransferase involved in cell wall biosynthesis